MKMNITRSTKMTADEKYARKIARIQGDIANAQRVLDWQVAEGYENLAEMSRDLIAKLTRRLAQMEQANG